MGYEYGTTMGTLGWDDKALHVVGADDPSPPDSEDDWEMCGSVISELRSSNQTILWFWKRPIA